eukprot:Pgem_evm1s735
MFIESFLLAILYQCAALDRLDFSNNPLPERIKLMIEKIINEKGAPNLYSLIIEELPRKDIHSIFLLHNFYSCSSLNSGFLASLIEFHNKLKFFVGDVVRNHFQLEVNLNDHLKIHFKNKVRYTCDYYQCRYLYGPMYGPINPVHSLPAPPARTWTVHEQNKLNTTGGMLALPLLFMLLLISLIDPMKGDYTVCVFYVID